MNERRPMRGRDAELAKLDAALGAAKRGDGALLTVLGEPGSGKSATLAHAQRQAVDLGDWVVSRTAGHPLQTTMAYLGVIDAFSPLMAGLEASTRREIMEAHAELSWLFPDHGPQQDSEGPLHATRVAMGLRRVLVAAQQRQPVLMLLDDLQWFDRESIAVLRVVCRALPTLAVVVVGSARNDSSGVLAFEQLRDGELGGGGEVIELAPIDASSILQIAQDQLGGSIPPLLGLELLQRSGGLPLAVVALVEELRASGRIVATPIGWSFAPGGLSGAGGAGGTLAGSGYTNRRRTAAGGEGAWRLIDARLRTLPPATMSLLIAVALHPEPLDLSIAAAVLRIDRATISNEAGSVVASTFCSFDALGRLTLTHPMHGERALATCSDAELVEMHRRFVLAVDTHPATEMTASSLAIHIIGAAAVLDPRVVLDALASRPVQGVRAAEIAADAARALGDATREIAELRRVARYASSIGDADRTRSALAAARAVSGTRTHPEWRMCTVALASHEFDQGDPSRALGLLDEVIDAVDAVEMLGAETARGTSITDDVASALSVMWRINDRLGDIEALRHDVERLGTLAGQNPALQCRHAMAEAALAHAELHYDRSDTSRRRAVNLARTLPAEVQPDLLRAALGASMLFASDYGDVVELKKIADELLELAEGQGDMAHVMRACGGRATAYFHQGHLEVAEREARDVHAIAQGAGVRRGGRVLSVFAMVRALRGDLDDARRVLASGDASAISDVHVRSTAQYARALVAWIGADWDDLRSLREGLEHSNSAQLVRRLDLAAESYVREGNSERALELAARIEAIYPGDRWVTGIAARHRAAVAVDDAQCRHWIAVALDSLDSTTAPLDRVRTLVTAAETTPSMVDPLSAELRWAIEFCDRGGLAPIGDRLRAALRDAGHAVQRRAPRADTKGPRG